MTKETLFEIIGELDDRFLTIETKKKKPVTRTLLTAAACVVLCTVLTLSWIGNSSEIRLMRTEGNVSVNYVRKTPHFFPHVYHPSVSDYISGEEILKRGDVDIFRGEVVSLRNIVILYNGHKEYRGLAQIRVDTVYRGSPDTDTVTILMPFGFWFAENMWVENTFVISQIKEGMEGIFFAKRYDTEDVSKMNGETLVLKDIAEYGLLDGDRWCILDGEDGLIYDIFVHEKLFAVQKETGYLSATLEDAEAYVEKILNE